MDFQKLSTTCWLFCWFFWWPASIINSQNPVFATVYIPLYIIFHVSRETFLIILIPLKRLAILEILNIRIKLLFYPSDSIVHSFIMFFSDTPCFQVYVRYNLFDAIILTVLFCHIQSYMISCMFHVKHKYTFNSIFRSTTYRL